MGALTKTFGRTPRVRLLEAFVRLAPVEFTRAEAMKEAGLHKSSTNRVLDQLEADRFIVRTSAIRPVRYRVNEEHPLFRLVAIANAYSENVVASRDDGASAFGDLASVTRALRRAGGPATPQRTARAPRKRPSEAAVARAASKGLIDEEALFENLQGALRKKPLSDPAVQDGIRRAKRARFPRR